MRRFLCTALTGGAFLAAISGALAAQAVGRDTLTAAEEFLFVAMPTVSAASRHVQGVAEAPASISIITREEIRRMGYRSLAEVLTSARGIYASNDRNYTYVGLRGFARTGTYNTRLLLMVDGHRINEPTLDYAGLALEMPVAVQDIERVEIVRGPGSSLYGSNAVLGVINVVTRRPTGAGAEAFMEGGNHGAWQGRAAWDGVVGPARVVLSGSHLERGGEDVAFPELAALIRGQDGERASTTLAKVYAGPLEVVAGFGQRHKDIPTGAFYTLLGGHTHTTDRRIFAFARYDHVVAGLGRATVRAAFDAFRYEGRYAYAAGPIDDFQASTWWTIEGQIVHPVGRHRVVVGGEARVHTDVSQGGELGGGATWADGGTSQVGALFIQDEIRIGRALLTIGLRHDHYSTVGGTTNPRGALILPLGAHTTVKLLAGRAFRAPNRLEAYYYEALAADTDAPLEPEFLSSYEAVLERALGSSTRFIASVYSLSFRNVLTLATNPDDQSLEYTNRGASDGHGMELEVEGRFGPVDARASYAYQRVSERGWEGDPLNAPRHLARLGGSLPLHRLVSLGLEARVVGDRRGRADTRVPGYLLTSARLIFSPLGDRLDVMLSGTNLLNARYADPGGEEHRQTAIPQEGRSVRLGLRARF